MTLPHPLKMECDQTTPQLEEEEEEEGEILEEFAIEFMRQDLESDSAEIYDNVVEQLFYINGGNSLDFLNWKKRVPESSVVSSIVQMFQLSQQPNSAKDFLFQLLHSSGRISDLSAATASLPTHHLHPALPSTYLLNSSAVSISHPNASPISIHSVNNLDYSSPAISEFATKAATSTTGVSLPPTPLALVPTTPTVQNAAQPISALSTPTVTPAPRQPSRSGSMLEEPAGTREQIVEQAKQEAYVMQRIAELRKNGVWFNRRLPKVQEPPRSKVHWDYLLEEMQWLAADFLQERKWKRNSAKKCSKMVLKYHSLKECQAERVEKEEQAKLKRIASNIAKMVKQFWSEIEKLIEFKQEVQLKEKRKKIHDMQLRFIVDKADHFTEKLAQEFVTPSLKNSRAPSVDSEQSNDELDTERHSKTANKSIAELLKKESEMPIEELADSLPQKFVEDLTSKEGAANEHDDDDVEFEFEKGTSCSDDDEETIAKEEDQEEHESVDHKDELNELASEAEIPIEDLLTRYGYGNETPPSDEKTDYTTADDDETENNDSEDSDDSDEEDEDEEADDSGDIGLDYLVNTNNKDASNGSDQTGESEAKAEITEAIAAAAAESIQPKGNTLSSVEVITKVPFLLKFQLREYQHIGLDWLVAMYEKNLNGILADEMGLGKTIQTISLIAHLACEKGIWGPHLIVVPTSVMLNWEMELKKWCPALKILTYYGNPKERRIKRKGWTKPNTFHVCITSYKLVVQDHASFRRKKWVYFILDEAQHIKNFKSQRWQMLLNFNSTRRLLLTGTPLQNNLMELWSLMHFLMPNVFQSHREFKDWFVNPVTGMIEGNQENDEIIRRLHKILRPFLLRRLKCDVEKQLPKKYEHIVQCSLSKRQRQLYDEYMSMGKTKETLASGNFLSVINILMQLRKVCNHPNLFEPRPTVSPFIDQEIVYCIPALVSSIFDYHPLSQIDLQTLNLVFLHLSTTLSHSNQSDIKKYQYNLKGMETAWSSEPQVYARISDHAAFFRMINRTKPPSDCNANNVMMRVVMVQNSNNNISKLLRSEPEHKLTPLSNNNSFGRKRPLTEDAKIISKNDLSVNSANQSKSIDDAPASKVRLILESANCDEGLEETPKEGTLGVGKYAMHETITRIAELKRDKLRQMSLSNKRRCSLTAFYTKDFIGAARFTTDKNSDWSCAATKDDGRPLFSSGRGFDHCFLSRASHLSTNALNEMLHTPETLENSLHAILDRFLCIVPNVLASPIKLNITHLPSYKKMDECNFVQNLSQQLTPQFFDVIQIPRIQLRFQLPELRLIQYDCGKLHVLDHLLWRLKSQKHRVLIFTQMSRMLDIFEQFLNYHGHTYLRLDGSTKIEQRHALMERFNSDQRIFCFILSTRSGGVGVNLTGADTVIFYDSDWNPTMDAQAQDRCHRIGQTRDVHIYRLVSERTVEENILRKAQQKKLLGDLAIEEGNFTTAFFKQAAIRELFDVDQSTDPASDSTEVVVSSGVQVDDSLSPAAADSNSAEAVTNSSSLRSAFEQALCTAEEDTDVAAAKEVRAEAAAEFIEFDENIPIEEVSEEKSPEEEEIERALSNLSAVERYAVKFFESQKDFQELKQAEEEIEETKKQWQKSIKEWRMNHEEERRKALIEYQDSIMTVTREDASMEKVFMSINGLEPMPIWAPPTPPQDENDLYIDYSLGFLYEQTLMPESQLPPIYIPKEHKRIRVDVPALPHGRKHLQPCHAANTQALTPSHAGPLNTKSNRRPDDLYTIPKSPFDRSTSFIIRFRRELLIMKMKLWPGSANLISSIQRTFANMGSSAFPQSNIASVQSLAKAHFNMKHYPRWLIHEEFSIIMVLIYLQDLPYNLSIICPGHIPNWDLVAEQVNTYNSFKRSMKFCKYHFESVLAAKNDPNHMGDDTPKTPLQSHLLSAKQSKSNKKSKNQQGQSVLNQQQTNSFQSSSASQTITLNPSMPVNATSLGAAGNKGLLNSPMASGNMAVPSPSQPLYRMANILQNMVADNNMEFTNEMNKRFDVIKQIVIQKTQTSKSRFIKKHQPKTFDHVSLLMTEYQIKYDKPLSVEEVAAIRAERISKDKQAAREQQVREAQQAQHINQMKAYLQGTASTPPAPQFHSAPINTMASPSVMASNSVAHIQQQQQSQSSASSAPHMQQQQQPTSSTGGLSQNINTPKHIIIGHPASLVGQSTAVVSTSSRNPGVASPALLQQVVSNQGSNNSNQQTRTFAIRTAYGHQIPAQPQPGTVYLSPLTLKTAASTGVSAQHNNQVKAFLQGTTSTPTPQFHSTPITISSPSVMATVTGMASNSVAHVQQQQQQQQQQQVQQPPANSVPLMQQQPQQQSTSTTNSLSQSINTPKHIIIRHPASLVGQSTAVVSTSSRNAGVASPALLQQVVSNQGSNNSSQQTRTFAIRTAYGHQIPAQPQPGTVYLSPLTLKTATSTTVSAQHSNQVKAFLQGTTSTSAAQFHSTPITISSPSVMATVSGMTTNSHVQQQQQGQPSVNSPQMQQQQQQQQSTSTTSSLPQSIATPKHIIIGHPNFIQ